MNVVKRIIKANRGRDPERLALKYRAMRNSPFAFFRGSCHLFYDRLAELSPQDHDPLVWCSGDLHLENFGSYKGDNRLVYFDINDFDEAALAPASWELLRFTASVLTGCQTVQGRIGDALDHAAHFLHAYADALVQGKARWIERETASGVAHDLLDQLRQRKRVDLLNSRTRVKGKTRRFLNDGVKTLSVTDGDRATVLEFMQRFAASQPDPDFYEVLDVSRRIAGTGSLGLERYAILVRGKGSPDQNYLLDLKRARSSSLAEHFTSLQPHWDTEAERIVTLEQRMQAVPMAFLHTVSLGKRSYVLRGLQPSEDRLPFHRFPDHSDLFADAMSVMGQCVAWAQLRSSGRQGSAIADELVGFGGKKKWQRKLVEMAQALAVQAKADWLVFCEAYDSDAFRWRSNGA